MYTARLAQQMGIPARLLDDVTMVPLRCRKMHLPFACMMGDYGGVLAPRARAGRAPGIFFDPCPTGDLLGGALSAVRVQCNYLDG